MKKHPVYLRQEASEGAFVVARDIWTESKTLLKNNKNENIVINRKDPKRKIIISQEPLYDKDNNPLNSNLTIYVETPDFPGLESSREAYCFMNDFGGRVMKQSFGGYISSEKEADKDELSKLWEMITGKQYERKMTAGDKIARKLLGGLVE